ncbi:MAG: SWIM zinc finger family protein [Chloroflexota bacterium]
MSTPKLTDSIIRAGASVESFQRGKRLYENGAISNTTIQGAVLSGDCEGTSAPYYRVRAELDDAGIRLTDCTCPYEYGGYCKHIVALLLTYAHHPKQFAIRRSPNELLADLSREDLLALMTQLLQRQPDLADWVETAISIPSAAGKAKQRRKPVDTSVYRRQITGILHSLDGMRASEAYWHVGGLATELDIVTDKAMQFLDQGDAESALAILLTLIEEVGHGVEYIDDSNGEMGDFMAGLGQPLAEVILSMELSALEQQKLLDQLTKLDKSLGNYGLDGAVSLGIEALMRGWADVPPKAQAQRTDDADDEDEYDDEEEWDDDEELAGWSPASTSDNIGDLTEAKLNVLARQGKTDEYLALCQRAGKHLRYALKLIELRRTPEAVAYALSKLTTAGDALQLAQKLRELRHNDEAISLGERGLNLEGSKAALGAWLAPMEEAKERNAQALQAWLATFNENPSLEIYKTLKRLASSDWSRVQPQAMQALRKYYSKRPLAEVYLHEQEWDEAIKLADARDIYGGVRDIVADGVIAIRPEWVIRVCKKESDAEIAHTNSKHYARAAEWLKRVKKAYAQLGQNDEWRKYLAGLKEEYKRRPALQKELGKL